MHYFMPKLRTYLGSYYSKLELHPHSQVCVGFVSQKCLPLSSGDVLKTRKFSCQTRYYLFAHSFKVFVIVLEKKTYILNLVFTYFDKMRTCPTILALKRKKRWFECMACRSCDFRPCLTMFNRDLKTSLILII